MRNPAAPVESSQFVAPNSKVPIGPGHNQLLEVTYKGGWPGLFAGENQQKALAPSFVVRVPNVVLIPAPG
jgi:hypothetical protein